MKEEYARKKWCKDRALVLAVEAITGNTEGTANCITTDCIHWVSEGSRTIGDTAGEYGHCDLNN